MNIYYFSPHLASLPIKQLTTMASFKNLAVGDIVLLRLDRRVVMAFINQPLHKVLYFMHYPMVAQVICDDDNLLKLRPIIYYSDGYREKIKDIPGLQFLHKLFAKESLATDVISETESLALGKIDKSNMSLALKLLNCNTRIPTINEDVARISLLEGSKDGKLLIVEQYFTERMKQDFYNNLSLGRSEREALVNIRRKYPKVFRRILTEFKDRDIYTRLS